MSSPDLVVRRRFRAPAASGGCCRRVTARPNPRASPDLVMACAWGQSSIEQALGRRVVSARLRRPAGAPEQLGAHMIRRFFFASVALLSIGAQSDALAQDRVRLRMAELEAHGYGLLGPIAK